MLHVHCKVLYSSCLLRLHCVIAARSVVCRDIFFVVLTPQNNFKDKMFIFNFVETEVPFSEVALTFIWTEELEIKNIVAEQQLANAQRNFR